ncbi:NtaA/DmoA family FMN-dependent monooxygenase [Curtobacterium sp. MCPF17_052]|uniref:NtaA/DmoA family FMN-dependent monooxygenase n=1 Tax=Curtobacterium sp. MCPF17_052 TaxID=2175655 RepID=UPI0034647BFA
MFVLTHRADAASLAVDVADVVLVTPGFDGREARDLVTEIRHLEETDPSRTSRPVIADLAVLIEPSRALAEDELAALDEAAGRPYALGSGSDAAVLATTVPELVARIGSLRDAGIAGVRLRPLRTPRDSTAIARQLVPALVTVGLRADVSSRPVADLRSRLGIAPRRQPLRPNSGGPRMSKRQVHLAAHFPGVNNTTVWSDDRAESQIAFSSFEHFARNAERGLFDFVFLAEGLRLREQKGRIHDLDVVGRPNTLTILAALAGVTDHIGLVGTLQTTFNEPLELAKQLATLDHLSGGRAGWNVVTSSDAFHGANFRRGGFLEHADRYTRAAEFVDTARELWDSWQADAVLVDRATGHFADRARIRDVDHHGPQFDVTGTFPVPRSPQGRPVVVQAGDSDEGRDLAATRAEVVFSLHTGFEDARRFSDDLRTRLLRAGRPADDLVILPGGDVRAG